MRAIRALAVAALVALDLSVAAAQPTRHFKDSWFWGLKGGGMFFEVQSDPDGSLAPLGGVDWMITRTNGGLYVSYDRAFFNQFMFVNDSVSPVAFTACPGDPTVTCGRQVNITDMNRFTLAGVLFPLQTYRLHPYIGFGATMNHIATTAPQGAYSNSTQQILVEASVQQGKSVASPVVILGSQFRLPLVSAFGQVSATPANRNFLLFTGGWRFTVEGGVRHNIGSSIDRMR